MQDFDLTRNSTVFKKAPSNVITQMKSEDEEGLLDDFSLTTGTGMLTENVSPYPIKKKQGLGSASMM